MIVGLVSDTHGFFDPRLEQALRGAEVIVHAGDVGSDDVIYQLRRIAPVYAVRGNVDSPDAGWPLTLSLALNGLALQALHILPAAQSDLIRWAAQARRSGRAPAPAGRLLGAVHPGAEVVVFGHSHEPCLVTLRGVLWVNPGSAGRKRFSLPRTCAVLDVSDDGVEARVVPLESHAGALPRRLRWMRRAPAQ